jgi:DNA-binding transcriptional regulator/RsmH inhibitor MraZ
MVERYIYWESSSYFGDMMENLEIKRIDSQGRLLLPQDWRKSLEGREVYIIKRKDYLKILAKRKIDLTAFFDSVDLGIDAIGDWEEFEERLYGAVE